MSCYYLWVYEGDRLLMRSDAGPFRDRRAARRALDAMGADGKVLACRTGCEHCEGDGA